MEESRLEAILRPASAKERCSGRRILVVDDNRDSTESLRLFLGMLGNEVAVAYDGLEAVSLLRVFGRTLLKQGVPRELNDEFIAARRQYFRRSIQFAAEHARFGLPFDHVRKFGRLRSRADRG